MFRLSKFKSGSFAISCSLALLGRFLLIIIGLLFIVLLLLHLLSIVHLVLPEPSVQVLVDATFASLGRSFRLSTARLTTATSDSITPAACCFTSVHL